MEGATCSLACYALTEEGAALARRLARALGADGVVHVFVPERLHKEGEHPFASLPVLVAQTFTEYAGHVFVGAAGIAVRGIAPHLGHKSTDPAVVVCDEGGAYAVSLLSGHWGGGNALARRVAASLGATPVITTATDTRRLPAVDVAAREAGCVILDWDKVKLINGALLRGETVQVYDPMRVLTLPASGGLFRHVGLPGEDDMLPPLDMNLPAVHVDWRSVPPAEPLLRLAIPALHVGVGCRRGVSAAEILAAVRQTLEKAALELRSVACLASVSAKEDEPGLCEAAQALGVPFRLFSPEELSEAPVLTPSAMAAQIFGVERISVSEGAALLSAGGEDATLLLPKVRYHECVTVAVALPEALLPGGEA